VLPAQAEVRDCGLVELDGHYRHYLDIYSIDIHVAVTLSQLAHMSTELNVMKGLSKKKHPPSGATHGKYGKRGGAEIYSLAFWMDRQKWIEAGSPPNKLADVAAHEAAHGAGMLWRHIGAWHSPVTLSDDEPMAYLIGWLTGVLYECVTAEDQ
jgi:hypothetical protein